VSCEESATLSSQIGLFGCFNGDWIGVGTLLSIKGDFPQYSTTFDALSSGNIVFCVVAVLVEEQVEFLSLLLLSSKSCSLSLVDGGPLNTPGLNTGLFDCSLWQDCTSDSGGFCSISIAGTLAGWYTSSEYRCSAVWIEVTMLLLPVLTDHCSDNIPNEFQSESFSGLCCLGGHNCVVSDPELCFPLFP